MFGVDVKQKREQHVNDVVIHTRRTPTSEGNRLKRAGRDASALNCLCRAHGTFPAVQGSPWPSRPSDDPASRADPSGTC